VKNAQAAGNGVDMAFVFPIANAGYKLPYRLQCYIVGVLVFFQRFS